MKIKIIERTHELDLQDDVNAFIETIEKIYQISYHVAMTSHKDELEYSFSCFIVYK